MRDRKAILFLILIMTIVSLVVATIAISVLYRTAIAEERARLVETAQSQARLIEAVARFDMAHSVYDHPAGARGATLSQITDAHRHYEGFGQTGEFTLARRDGRNMVFLMSHRHGDRESPEPVPFDSVLAEPMRRSLSGESGTVIGPDYRGVQVLAAHEPVAELDWGIVAKIDLAEIRAPFGRAGMITGGAALIVVLIGAVCFVRVGTPLVRRLGESEARMRAIVDSAADGIITIDDQGVIDTFNKAAERIFDYAADQAVGRNIKQLMWPPHFDYGISGDKVTDDLVREANGRRRDGTLFQAELAVSEVRLVGRRIFVVVVRDITERKRVEEELQRARAGLERRVAERTAELTEANERLKRGIAERKRLESEILETGQREQQRIGRDLHDTVGQHLTGIAFLAKVLERRLTERGVPEAAKASRIAEMVSETIAQARALSRGLCPVDLAADGLMTALREYAANVESLFDIACDFKCDEPVLVHNEAVATHLYRVAQEAVSNAVKHGRARGIEIGMAANEGRPVLTVKDDGVGLPADAGGSPGMGMRIMRYRAGMIGADLDIRRHPDGGTIVECSFKSDLQAKGENLS